RTIVPLLLIRMKVMIAIRISGMLLPPIVKAKTSLGFGHGTVVDIRTVMYEIRKELKMNVSLSRKIHIIALPQGTFLNARWSEDQSATMPSKPSGRGRAFPGPTSAGCAISLDPLRYVYATARRTEPARPGADSASRSCTAPRLIVPW